MSTDGAVLTPQNAGYYEGTTDVYYARMTSMDTMNAAPAYAAPVCLGKSIDIQVTPNYKESKVYASNAATRRDQLPETYTVQLNLDQVIPERRQELLGRDVQDDGVELVTGNRIGPLVAILFAATMDDGTKEYWQLYKGRFSEPTYTHHTMNDGESYQHPTISGTFVRLDGSDKLAGVFSEDTNEIKNATSGTSNRNLLLGTNVAYTFDASALTAGDGPEFEVSERGQEMSNHDSAYSYELRYKLNIVWEGQGDAPTLSSSGTIRPRMELSDGYKLNGDNLSIPAAGERTMNNEFKMSATVAARGSFAALKFTGTGWATAGWTMTISEVSLKRGTTGGVLPNASWTPAPEDFLNTVII